MPNRSTRTSDSRALCVHGRAHVNVEVVRNASADREVRGRRVVSNATGMVFLEDGVSVGHASV